MNRSSLSTLVKRCAYVQYCGYKYASVKPQSFASISNQMLNDIFCQPAYFTIITINTQQYTHFKMARINKLEKNDYKESSVSINFSLLTTFNLPSY